MRSVIIAIGLLLIAGSAVAKITNSSHDFRTADSGGYKATGTGADELCAYCHTPHSDQGALAAPLWNKNGNISQTFTAYGTTVANTTVGDPSGVSKVCLSCHDGTVAAGTAYNKPNSGWTDDDTKLTSDDGYQYLGADMRDDHPVSISYTTSQSKSATGLKAAGSLNTNLVLFGANKNMECATCHDVHRENETDAFKPMLTMSNASSGMCQDCHQK